MHHAVRGTGKELAAFMKDTAFEIRKIDACTNNV